MVTRQHRILVTLNFVSWILLPKFVRIHSSLLPIKMNLKKPQCHRSECKKKNSHKNLRIFIGVRIVYDCIRKFNATIRWKTFSYFQILKQKFQTKIVSVLLCRIARQTSFLFPFDCKLFSWSLMSFVVNIQPRSTSLDVWMYNKFSAILSSIKCWS